MNTSKSKIKAQGKILTCNNKKILIQKKIKKDTSQLELLSAKVSQNASKYGKMTPNASQSNHNPKENSRTKSEFLKVPESPQQGRISKEKIRKGQLNPNKHLCMQVKLEQKDVDQNLKPFSKR